MEMRKDKIDFQNIYEGIIPAIQEANKGITHEEFAKGAKNGTMGFKVMYGEPSELIRGGRKIMFNILVMLYFIVPFILVPIWAYIESNWWLLIGAVISFIATRFSAKLIYNEKRQNSIGGFLFIVSIILWIDLGIHNYYTFFTLSALWGFMFFHIADSAEKEYAMQMLVESKELFEQAIAENKIMIIHKDKEDIKRAKEINEDKALAYLNSGEEKYANGDYNGAIMEYSKAIEYYPFVSAFENRGHAKMKLKDYSGAVIDYTAAIKRMPSIPDKKKFAVIYRNRGEAKRALNLGDEAELDFIEADKLNQVDHLR